MTTLLHTIKYHAKRTLRNWRKARTNSRIQSETLRAWYWFGNGTCN